MPTQDFNFSASPKLAGTKLSRPKFRFWRRIAYAIVAAFLILAAILFRSPSEQPAKSIVSVTDGQSVSQVASELAYDGIINSELGFKLLVRLFGRNGVKTGDYFFDRQTNIFTVARRLSRGDFELKPVKITIPEGTSAVEIAAIIKKAIPDFGTIEFITKARPKDGYLFPDTYFFAPNITPDQAIAAFADNFNEKISTIQDKISASGRPLADIIKMASYLEEEARQTDTRRIIAGILWKRIDIGMPLQIDAAFQYVNGKNSSNLTLTDLQIDSAYNTYKYRGFTPTPITNPGLDSILAAVTPIKTNYLYFLTDPDGNMHYAMTNDEHVANKIKYLK